MDISGRTMAILGVLLLGASLVPQARQLFGAALGGIAREFGGYAVKLDEREKDRCAEASAHWTSTEKIGTKAAFEDHLMRFPSCNFAGLAGAGIAALDTRGRTPEGSLVAEPAPLAPSVPRS
jgi:hypothetical protein